MAGLIKFQDVYRDAIQSLFGTNPSADEIIAAYKDAVFTGVESIQVAGGTFYDLFAKKGRDEWKELEKITEFFKGKGVKLSALIRGDFLFTYEPQPYDVIYATVLEHAKLGINVLQCFHGMNDARCMIGVAKAVREIKKLENPSYDIAWQGTICIEDNPNITVDECLKFARELNEMGCEGFYLKSASGRLDPDFVYELTSKLYLEFPDQPITIHAHSTYGEAPICYMAAAKAALEQGKEITMDVQHPALAGSTAQPSMLKMLNLIKNHPLKMIKENAPQLNIDAIKKNMKSLFEMRFLYRDSESTYNPRLLAAMKKARVPGGASATLRGIDKLEDNLKLLLETDDWDEIQIAVYEMQAEILDDLGQPTQVTPYAANTTSQAGFCVYNELTALHGLKAKIKTVYGNKELNARDKWMAAQEILSTELGSFDGYSSFLDEMARIQTEPATFEEVMAAFENTSFWEGIITQFKQSHRYDILYPGMVNYLVGRHGRVPDSVNKDLQAKALKHAGLSKPVDYVLSTDRPNALPDAVESIKEKKVPVSRFSLKRTWGGLPIPMRSIIEEPSIRQAISAVLLKDGVQHVINCFTGQNKPQDKPDLPYWAQKPANDNERYTKGGVIVRDIRDAIQAIGGTAKLQEIAERALHLKQIDDDLYEFPRGEEDLEGQWREGNIAHISQLMDGIPELLKGAGFLDQQAANVMGEWNTGNVYACIKDACDNKGEGLYNYMMQAVEGYKNRPDVEHNNVHDFRSRRDRSAAQVMTGYDTAVYSPRY